MKKYNPAHKPDPRECPRHFCFCWHGPRSRFASGAEQPVPATSAAADGGSDGRCASPFGVCTRYNPEQGDHDWYEPHEPNLEEAGLPWFYFIPTPEKLVPVSRRRYIEETEPLWGKKHWENDEEAA